MLEKNLFSPFPLLQIPTELLADIASFLDIKSLLSLRVVNVFFEKLTQALFLRCLKHNQFQIACGGASSYLVTARGNVYPWGENFYGQLGLNHRNNIYQPQFVSQLRVVSLAANYIHALTLTADGEVYSCGSNRAGQLGFTNVKNVSTPTLIPELKKITYVAAGWQCSFALNEEGTAYAWGFNYSGQLGLENQDIVFKPEIVNGLKDIIKITSRYGHTLALTKSGTVYSWGANDNGELGLGHNDEQNTPIIITRLKDVIDIEAGFNANSFCITLEGVYTWGKIMGELGLMQQEYNTPQLISGLKNIARIVPGEGHTLALTKDGKIYSWGENEYGQLGIGNTDHNFRPQLVPGLNHVTHVAAGGFFNLALTEDNTLYAWGKGGSGQLGLNNKQNGLSPQLVSTIKELDISWKKKIIDSMVKRKLPKINLEDLHQKNITCSTDTKLAILKVLDNYFHTGYLNFFAPKKSKLAQGLKDFINYKNNLFSISHEIKTYKRLNQETKYDEKFDTCLSTMQKIIECSQEKELALRTAFTNR